MLADREEKQIAKLREQEYREEIDRVTAVQHIQVEHFSKHVKIEGYHEYEDAGRLFGCDRLMKIESMYGRMQLGYNPNRKRSFVFANIKTSRYDTADSRYQRELKEYQMKSLLKGENQNLAYVAKRMNGAAVLLEKADTKPWSEETVKPYYRRSNVEALQKNMPFLSRNKQRERLKELKQQQKNLQNEIQENINEGRFLENEALRSKQRAGLQEENLLENLLLQKAAVSKYFMRKINYAFDIQKHEMFEYYKNKAEKMQQEAEAVNGVDDEDEHEE